MAGLFDFSQADHAQLSGASKGYNSALLNEYTRGIAADEAANIIKRKRSIEESDAEIRAGVTSQMQAWDSDPANAKKTPLQRWQAQLDMLNQTANPAAQGEAASSMQAFNKATIPNLSTLEKEFNAAEAQGFPGTIADWALHKKSDPLASARTGIGDRFQNAEGSDVPVPAYSLQSKVREQGLYPRAKISAGDAGRLASLNTSINSFAMIDPFLLPEGGEVNTKVLDGAFYLSLDPTSANYLSTNALKIAGYSPAQITQAKLVSKSFLEGIHAITRTETGAAMPDSDIEAVKKRFFPTPTDSPEVKKQKYLAYKFFITNASDMINPSIRKGDSGAQLSREIQKTTDEIIKKFGLDKKVETDGLSQYDFGDDADQSTPAPVDERNMGKKIIDSFENILR